MVIDHKSLDTMHYLLHTAHVGNTMYNLEVDSISIQTVKVTNPFDDHLQLLARVQHVVCVLT